MLLLSGVYAGTIFSSFDQAEMFAAICEGPWLTEIKEDPSSETPVFFNDRAVQAVPICAAEFKRMVICREGRLSKGLCFTNATS